jgi:hypothetical protein
MPIPESNRVCKSCHPEIYAQWEGSMHAQAWDDPQLQIPGIRIKENPDCWPCHVPEPVFPAGLDRLPYARSSRRSEGIGCISCHYTAKGMAGKIVSEDPPCRPVINAAIVSLDLCRGCHNQHKTHDEWKTSRFHPDTGCNDCHMPWIRGTPTRGRAAKKYRAHTWPGAHDLAMLRRAVTLSVRLEGKAIAVIEITNEGAGHNFPTDARFHRADLKVDVLRGGGKGQACNQFEYAFRNPFRWEYGTPNTQIKPQETKRFRRGLTVQDGVLRVRLFYSLVPYPTQVAENLSGSHQVVLKEVCLPIR